MVDSLPAKKLRPVPAGVRPAPITGSFLGVPCLLLGRLADHPTTAATAVAAAPEAGAPAENDERRGDSFTRLSQDALRALRFQKEGAGIAVIKSLCQDRLMSVMPVR